MMHSNFEDPLTFSNNGQELEVCGKLFWDEDPGAKRALVSVTIKQKQGANEVVAEGTAPREFIRPEAGVPGDEEWMFVVTPPPGERFLPGVAEAIGVLTVTNQPGSMREWRPEPFPPGHVRLTA